MAHAGKPGADPAELIRCPAPGTESVSAKAFGLTGCGSANVVEIQPDGWYKCLACGLDFDDEKVKGMSKSNAADGMARLEHDVVTLPPDQQALGLVEPILEQTAYAISFTEHPQSLSRCQAALGIIQGDAERLKVLLEKQPANVGNAMDEIAGLERGRTALLEALKWYIAQCNPDTAEQDWDDPEKLVFAFEDRAHAAIEAAS